MRKIVVFDSGWGGELVADYLMRELNVVEVIRVIDWAHQAYRGLEPNFEIMADLLRPYVGNVDLIVLGGYAVGMMLDDFKRTFPAQAFVAPSVNYDKILRTRQYPEQVAVLTGAVTRSSGLLQELREKLPYSTLILPECENWEDLIDNNLMTEDVVRTELAWDFVVCKQGLDSLETRCEDDTVLVQKKSLAKCSLAQAIENFGLAAEQARQEERRATMAARQAQEERVRTKPDLVLILNTHFWEIKPEIERNLGWQVRVLDFREKLLHDVCAALKLRGVDGRRAK